MTDSYSIAQLVTELRKACAHGEDERAILASVRSAARRAARSPSAWVRPEMYEADAEQGFGVRLLHEEPDHTLAVLAVSWLPRRGAPPHNHGTWAVIAGVHGMERNEFYERQDDHSRAGYAALRQIGAKNCAEGDVIAMTQGMIHSVYNGGDSVSLSLHIYGKHINYTGRSQFDPETGAERPFILKTA